MIQNEEREPIMAVMDYKGAERSKRPFYCCKCGKCVCETTGEATALIPGEPQASEMGPLGIRQVVRCGGVIYLGRDRRIRCTATYFFN